MPRHASSTAIRVIACGALLGLAGVLLFGTVHALAIVPIWGQLAGGIPFAAAAGIALTWAYHELRPFAPWTSGVGGGLRFGALCLAAGLPATALANALRLRSPHQPLAGWVDVACVMLVATSGAIAFGAISRRWRPAIAGAVAMAVLLAAGSGPIPVANGGRAIRLGLGFVVVQLLGGAVLGALYPGIVGNRHTRRSTRPYAGDDEPPVDTVEALPPPV